MLALQRNTIKWHTKLIIQNQYERILIQSKDFPVKSIRNICIMFSSEFHYKETFFFRNKYIHIRLNSINQGEWYKIH